MRWGRFAYGLAWLPLAAFAATVGYWGTIAGHVRAFQVLYGAAFLGFAGLALSFSRDRARSTEFSPGPEFERDASPHPGRFVTSSRAREWPLRNLRRAEFAGAMLLRLLTLAVEPSDDLYRYVWEGRVQLAGYNPFLHAPQDPLLTPLRNEDWTRINHKDYPAIYPPLAQMVFAAVAAVRPTVWAMKMLFVVADGLTVLVLGRWLARAGRSPRWALLYGLCPLTLWAFAIEGHLDSLMLLCLTGAGWAAAAGRTYRCAALIGLAVSAKLVAVVLVIWLVRVKVKAAILATAVIIATYGPYLAAGRALLHSLVRFGTEREFFSMAYGLLADHASPATARLTAAIVMLGATVYLLRRRRPLEAYAIPMLNGVLLFLPVMHFWYVSWILMFLSLSPRMSWWVLAGTMVFYSEAQRHHDSFQTWAMPEWVWAAVYGPFAAVWVAERLLPVFRGRLSDSAAPSSSKFGNVTPSRNRDASKA